MSNQTPPAGTFAERQAAFDASPEGIAKKAAKDAKKNKYKQQGMNQKIREFAGFDPAAYAATVIESAKTQLAAGTTHTITDFAAGEEEGEGGLNYNLNWKQHMAQHIDGTVISAQTSVEVDLDAAKGKLWDAHKAGVEGAKSAYDAVYEYKLSILPKEDEDE